MCTKSHGGPFKWWQGLHWSRWIFNQSPWCPSAWSPHLWSCCFSGHLVLEIMLKFYNEKVFLFSKEFACVLGNGLKKSEKKIKSWRKWEGNLQNPKKNVSWALTQSTVVFKNLYFPSQNTACKIAVECYVSHPLGQLRKLQAGDHQLGPPTAPGLYHICWTSAAPGLPE